MARRSVKRVCFDLETEAFSKEFRDACDDETRRKHAPKLRLACVFDGTKWFFFLPEQATELLRILSTAQEVISFNGKHFDELVLQKHHGLRGSLPSNGKHVDLCDEVFVQAGYKVKLHQLAVVNLNERKHTQGRNIANLDLEALKAACHSDVWQTYRLWQLWSKGKLQIPARKKQISPRKEEVLNDDCGGVGPGHHMRNNCPLCHSVRTLVLIDEDVEDMTDGQLADYEAGLWGTAICKACGADVDWEA